MMTFLDGTPAVRGLEFPASGRHTSPPTGTAHVLVAQQDRASVS